MTNTPQIRFKGNSHAWEQRKLGEVAEIIMGQSPDSKNYTNNPDDYILVQGNADMKNGKVVPRVWTTQITKTANKGDLILSVRAPVGDVGKTDYDVVLGRGVAAVKGNEFVFQTLTKMKMFGFWEKVSSGSTFESINSSDVKDAIIFVPTDIDEQTRIGTFFRTFDNTIALYKRKLDGLRKLKKAYLQRMFPQTGESVPRLRFAGLEGEWVSRKLGETATYFTDGNYGESYPTAKDMATAVDGVPFLRGSDLKNGRLDSKKATYISKKTHAELTSGHIEYDDIVIAVRGSLGALGYADANCVGWNINSQLAILRTDKAEIFGHFLIQFLLGTQGQRELESRATGTALKQLPIKQLKDVPVPLTTLPEQTAIGEFFRSLDNQIATQAEKLKQAKRLKSAYLQKMLV